MAVGASLLHKFFPQYRVVHRLPGRLRIHIPLLEKVPSNWHTYSDPVSDMVKLKGGIEDVNIQPLTGRILIHYRPGTICEEEIKQWLIHLAETFLELSHNGHGLCEQEFMPLLDQVKIRLSPLAG
jgi:hypothetical protein